MRRKKGKGIPFAGLLVILIGLTAVLLFFIREQPDPGRTQQIATQQKEETDEETSEIKREETKETGDEKTVEVHGTGHLYYLDPEGDQTFLARLTHFIRGQDIEADNADVLEYCIDDQDKRSEPAQFFLELDDDHHTIVRVIFEKKTGIYRFDLYDGSVPVNPDWAVEGEEWRKEKEISERTEDEAVPKSSLSITDPEGELETVAGMKELKKHLRKFLRSEGEGRRNFYVSSVTVTEDGYVAVLCFETVRQDGRNVEITYDGDYYFYFV